MKEVFHNKLLWFVKSLSLGGFSEQKVSEQTTKPNYQQQGINFIRCSMYISDEIASYATWGRRARLEVLIKKRYGYLDLVQIYQTHKIQTEIHVCYFNH